MPPLNELKINTNNNTEKIPPIINAKTALPIPCFSGFLLISRIARIPNSKAMGAGNIKMDNNPAYPAAIARPDLPTGRIMRIPGLSSIALGCG